MNTKQTLILVDNNLEPLKRHLINLYGDEGHDIGDAGNAAELLGNTIPKMNDTHDSYERKDFYRQVALFLKIEPQYVFDAIKEMETWGRQEWSESGAWAGFI